MSPSRIWLLLPAYNEADNLLPLLESIRAALDRTSGGRYTVVLVNDASTDDTARIAAEYLGRMPLRVVNHSTNLGLGGALRSGVSAIMTDAKDDDLVVFMDADNTHSPELITAMERQIVTGPDIVIASRYRAGARVIGVSFWRRLLSSVASLMFMVFHPMSGVRDYSCGFRMIRVSLLRKAITEYGDEFIATTQSFSVVPDLLLKLRQFRPSVTEIPLVLRYDRKLGTSKMRVARTAWASLRLLLKYYG